MKDGSAEAVKDVILQPSKSPTNLFSCVAQYKDTDDNFIYIELNTLENRMDADQYYLRGYSRPLTPLLFRKCLESFLVTLRSSSGLILIIFNRSKLFLSYSFIPHLSVSYYQHSSILFI